MASLYPKCFDKIANPDFAIAALHGSEPHGEFKAIVRFAQPEKRPTDIKVMEIYSEDLFKVRIPCDQIEHFTEDGNVLRVDIQEHISSAEFDDE